MHFDKISCYSDGTIFFNNQEYSPKKAILGFLDKYKIRITTLNINNIRSDIFSDTYIYQSINSKLNTIYTIYCINNKRIRYCSSEEEFKRRLKLIAFG